MRRFALVLLSVSLIGDAAYGRVKATVRVVPSVNPAMIPTLCGAGVNLMACTAFRSEKMNADCKGSAAVWRMDPEASYELTIYLTEKGWLAHEMLHIRDVKTYVEGYLSKLRAREFDSKELCQSNARIQSMVFPQVMNTFKEDSNEKRHPGYVRRGVPVR